jgi:O-antigen ligase
MGWMTSTAIRQTFPAGSPAAGTDPASATGLYSLRLVAILQAFRRQPLSFWLVCLYMLFEYVRPQAIYPVLAKVPWAQLLILATPTAFLLEGARFKARNPINLWMVAFSGAVVLSWAFALYPEVSQEQMFIYINWVFVFVLVGNIANTETRFFIFYGLFLLASFKMSQHGARSWAERGFRRPSGAPPARLDGSRTRVSSVIQMCVFFPLVLYFIGALKKYWVKWKRILILALPITAVMSLIATNSRGAMVGAGAVGLWMLARAKHRVRGFVALGALTALVVLVMPEEQKERFRTMGDDNTSESRLTYWGRGIDMFKAHPITGIGYENWAPHYEATYGSTVLPHNIFIQGGAELGSVGLIALVGLIVASFVVNHRTASWPTRWVNVDTSWK